MKAILTGMNGTVAPVVARRLWESGHTVVAWDRSEVSIEDPRACRAFLEEIAPDRFFHIATGSPVWAETVARLCAEMGVRFLFTSSVSVFSDRRQGPHGVDVEPDATDDYGRYKIECERGVRAANPEAVVARLAWQIGDARGSNNMLDHLWRMAEREGRVAASPRFHPSCAFLDDTAETLCALIERAEPDTYHLEGNPGLSFYEIASGLNRLHDAGWEVVESDAPVLDNRMADPRVAVAPITARLEGTC